MKLLMLTAALLMAAQSFAGEWKSDSEAGIVIQDGNSKAKNTYIKTTIKKESGSNTYTVEGSYLSAETTNVETDETNRSAEYSRFGLRYDRAYNAQFSSYVGALWEKDNFAGFRNRYSGDIGAKYIFIQGKENNFFGELGYRFRTEEEYLAGGLDGDDTESNFVRGYLEVSRKLNPTSNVKFWVEALYDMSESENFEARFEPSISVGLNDFFSTPEKAAVVSLKIGYLGRFDNMPAVDGLERLDSTLTTTLNVIY